MSSFSISVEENVYEILEAWANLRDNPITYDIVNNLPYMSLVEFGSGIYSELPGASKTPIRALYRNVMIIPILNKRYGASQAELDYNYEHYNNIFRKLQSKYPKLLGFIFRTSVKGQKPQWFVRRTEKFVKNSVKEHLIDWVRNGIPNYTNFEIAIRNVADDWYDEIVSKTPVLTSELKTGWERPEKIS